ncbi:DUF2252 domain-containing protein [Streptomyces neyagawaensis]|uniref:DUF2252 domain-containing protein n=3 Tax=Streptomyces neyagawaensis TaxID=42238 RepID=UPI00201CFF67|nr:DUF2252 domain-containing protein [Streptomyces neyagawaensis]MCL6731704.1 DUF2252 domain-containing protein [Streptomyces neyagawaensis]MDE1683260.1 DUF2252 domain-containing protein [Streptomyces neyagawaensis]
MSQNATTAMRAAPHATPEERAALGKAARRRSPRSGHAVYQPSRHRPDPLSILETQSAARVPELVPIRYGRMMESPFRFYRGAAAIMASDLAGSPSSGLTAQLCGDAHMLNFRLLASPERQLMFDINDFDETLPGPWEWDVKRLSASLVIAGRANGFDDAQRARIVRATVRQYRESMIRFAGMGNLDVWYAKVGADVLETLAAGRLAKRSQRNLSQALAKARTRDSLQVFDKLTETVDGLPRIAADPPLLVPVSDLLPDIERVGLERQFRGLLERYGRTLPSDRRTLLEDYRLADVARKVVGVGSVGTRCWIFLLLGRDGRDPLFLQAKEADTSVLAPHVGASKYANQGERVVSGQRLMQATSDIFLGWERVDGFDGKQRDFYVRQLRDWKGIAMPERMRPKDMRAFGALCGFTLARAHARSGDRIAIAAYLGGGESFDRALATFAEAYADQNERDHEALTRAVRAGRLPAQELQAA